MKKIIICILVGLCVLTSKVSAEELTWGSCTTYAPMPVLFIHGINSNCKTWDTAIPELEKYFGYRLKKFNEHERFISYSKPGDPTKGVTWFISQDGKYESPSKLYLETFDYGGEAKGVENLFIFPACKGSFYPISSYFEALGSKTTEILRAYYGDNYKDNPTAKLNIVAHSMGGLVARYYIQHGGADKVNRLITIGTPHKGSGLATLAKHISDVHPLALIGFGPKAMVVRKTLETVPHVRYGQLGAIEDLRPNSEFLKGLNKEENVEKEKGVEHVAIVGLSKWSGKRGDLVVNRESQIGTGALNNIWDGIIKAHHLSETDNWGAILTALDGIPDKGDKHYDTPRVVVRFANKLPDSSFSLGSSSVTYKGSKERFCVVGKVYDYLAGSATISIELNNAGNYAKNSDGSMINSDGNMIRDMALKPLQMQATGDVSLISGDKYNTYFAYKLNLDDLGTGTYKLRVTVTNPASLTTTATTASQEEWIPFTIVENSVHVRVAMAASPAVDIPQGIVAKADCYYFDNQGREYEKPLYDNLRVDSDSIIRYRYVGNVANPNYSHRILLESRVEGLENKKPIATVVNGNNRVYTYASYPFNLVQTTNTNGEVVYMADVDDNGTITNKDVVIICNNKTVNVPSKQGQTVNIGVGSIAPDGVNIAYSGGVVTTPVVPVVTQQINYDLYTNPVGALYILKGIQQAYNYTRSLEVPSTTSASGETSLSQSSFNPVVNITWIQNKDCTARGVSSYGTQSGRIEINGSTGDEFKLDRVCQAYGNYLLIYHCRKQYQLIPETRSLTPDEAFMNGLCMRYSSGVRGADTASIPGRDEIICLGSSTHRGVNSSIAVAQALFRLPMKQIWQALYHPTTTITNSGYTVFDLLDEIDIQFGSNTTKSIRGEFFADGTSGGYKQTDTTTSGSDGTTTTIPAINYITISPANIIMPTGGTVTFTVKTYDSKGGKFIGTWTPEWYADQGMGTFTTIGTSAVFIAGNTPGTVTITARYGTLTATAQVVIVEKGPVEVSGSQEGVWYKRLSPYMVTDDIIVDKDKTLRIEPGVMVVFMRGDKKEYYDDFDPEDFKDDPWMQGLMIELNKVLKGSKGERKEAFNRRVFTVMGRLEAEGTADERIVFTSGKKIKVELGVYEGIWKYLRFAKGSSGTLRHCELMHGGLKFGNYTMNDLVLEPQVLIESENVSMERCKIYESAGIGIQIKGATNCVLRGNDISGIRKKGVVIEDSRDVLIEGNSISEVDAYGIESVRGVTGTITRNTVMAGIFPFCQDGTSFPWYSDNIIAEGKGVAIMGNMGLPEGGVLRNAGMPYFIHRVTIPQGCSLRIEKGVVCVLGQIRYQSGEEYRNSGEIVVKGKLFAEEVVFKPRGEGYWPWNRIVFNGEEASGSVINGCTFEGGGYVDENQYDSRRLQNETGMIVIENSAPRIEGCVFKGNRTHFGGSRSGIMLDDPQKGLVITNNRIEGMRGGGMILKNCRYSPNIYNNIFSKNRAPFYQDANSSVRYMANTYIENANTAIVVGDIRNPLPYGGGITPPIMGRMGVPLTTWYKQNLPYLLDGWFGVSVGSTLKIEPGVVVKMTDSKMYSPFNGFDIDGRLEAEGTPDLPIVFTSVNNDEYYDDNKPEPKPGEGNEIRFKGTSSGVFKHCVVKYGEGINLLSPNSPAIEDCTFTKNTGGYNAGVIYVENCSPVIRNNIISSNVTSVGAAAIKLNMASPRIENNVISQNEGSKIYHGIRALDNRSCPIIIGNTIEGNGGLPYYHPPAGRFIYQGNKVKGNGYQAIGINETDDSRIDRDVTWRKEELPYLVMWHGIIVGEKRTLTIEPGVVVKFMGMDYWHNTRLHIKGNLIAEGTQDKPIIFTSMVDDSAGGKTVNIDSIKDNQPYPGSWGGILFFGGKGTLTNCYIRYGCDGLKLQNNDSADKRYANVAIKDLDIRYNSGAGIKNEIFYSYMNSGLRSLSDKNELMMEGCIVTKNGGAGLSSSGRLYGTISYNNIYNNDGNGMSIEWDGSGSIVVAPNNWWGTTTPIAGRDIRWRVGESRVVFEPWMSYPLPNVAAFVDYIKVSPATVTIGQEMKWMFNVGAYDREKYLLPSPSDFRWEIDGEKGSLTVNDTMAIFHAGTRTGTASITVRWGSLSTTAQVRVIEYSYGTLSGTLAMRRDKEIWLMSADGKVLREVSRDKTSTYPKLSQCGRYLAYGKQGYSEKQSSLFMCDLREGIEQGKLYACWYWDGTGPQRRVISGWTFARREPRNELQANGHYRIVWRYTSLGANLFLITDGDKCYHTKFDQDITQYNSRGIYHYPAIDDSGRIFGYDPNAKVISYWNEKEGKAVVLASSIKDNPYPVISPDGVWMAYLNDRDIYITDINDMSNNRRITNTNRVGGPFAWSPDGQSLVYPQQEVNNGQWDLWIITIGGKYPRNITNTPNIDEDQVDWSPADIMENMPKISRIGIIEPEVAVVPNESIPLKPCVYYHIPDEEGYPIEHRIIEGFDFGTVTWRLDGGVGTLSSTTGREVVYYGGNKCGEGSLTLCWGSYTESLRVVVAPSIVFPCIKGRGSVYGGGYMSYEKEGTGKYPIMEVWIDGKKRERVTVGEEWRQYPVRHRLLPGTHTIDICFTNDRGGRDLFVERVNIGSISLNPTYSLRYDRGENNKTETWFDGKDIVSESDWRRFGGASCMPWTGALRFVVYVEGVDERLARAAVMSQIITGLSEKVYAFPNPCHTDVNLITFVGVVGGARLQVYNIAGEKVFEKVLDASDVSAGRYSWKPQNNDGQILASGVYLYIISYMDEIRIGKIGIIR